MLSFPWASFNHDQGASASRWGAQGQRLAHAQGLCRSRGGLTAGIHTASDALGNPVPLIGGPGQQHDIAQAEDLIDGIKADAVIADKGYDTNKIKAKIAPQGSEVVIPPKRNRKSPRTYDKERNLIGKRCSASTFRILL